MEDKFLLFDGGMGTELQKRGLRAGGLPELMNLTAPDTILDIHRAYVNAGADVVTANTFGANAKKLRGKADVGEIVTAAITIAKKSGAKKAALDLGPIGTLLKPFGPLEFDEAYELYKEQVLAGAAAGADIAVIETISDLQEARAALLAVKENSDLPVFVTMTFGADGRTFLGTDPVVAALTLPSLGADAVGINCSLGPEQLVPLIDTMLKYSTVPVMVQPNAGLPVERDGETTYPVGPEEFAASVARLIDMGVSIVGGCCGTTPEHIRLLRRELDSRTPVVRSVRRVTCATSGQRAVILEKGTVAVVGERINPTGKKRIKEALRSKDYDAIMNEAIGQSEAGADMLDVNAGLPEIDEPEVLTELVRGLQGVTALPLMIDSSDAAALERACRIYAGKAVINSVNGKRETMDSVFPVAKKYGAAVVALTLDEDGIPEKAEDRLKIAGRIVENAEKYGIPREDIIVDCLTLTASTNQRFAMETLRAVGLVTDKLGLRTVLGVSNVSFGLPSREIMNAAFLAAALGRGLSMPIMNPFSERSMEAVRSLRVISGEDTGAAVYIASYSGQTAKAETPVAPEDITSIVLSGRKTLIAAAVRRALAEKSAMEVIDELLIPAINAAGDKFEKGEFFLPQLMASAETVKLGFDEVKSSVPRGSVASKGKLILATVKGDIHDIGKNIVKLLLQNYGYEVIDLGKDVPPERVVEETVKNDVKLVGLSALMTTTVRSMADTIRALRESGCGAKVMAGGAVLTEEYAKLVGADFYVKDAAASARVAQRVLGGK